MPCNTGVVPSGVLGRHERVSSNTDASSADEEEPSTRPFIPSQHQQHGDIVERFRQTPNSSGSLVSRVDLPVVI